ncbi:MAG: ABC transporter permease [Chloroflexi bacterium]|nr:ABC transporter permease [Chloroflexota bacterium]
MTAEATQAIPRKRSRRNLQAIGRHLRRDKRSFIGVTVLGVVILMAVTAPITAPYDPFAQIFGSLESPSIGHPLGTDDLGRDLLSRIMHGARISLIAGLISVASAALIGIFLGLTSGYYGGWIDMLVMRYIDLQWAFPNFIIAVALVAIFGTGLENVIVAISLAYIDDFARVTRGMVLGAKEEDYVLAGRALGASDARLMWRHILPNSLAPVLVQASVLVSGAILFEASLSFLGLGVKPETPTWGLILNDARLFVTSAWWFGIFPGVAIMFLVLAINFVGDGLRDFFDVREYGPGAA